MNEFIYCDQQNIQPPGIKTEEERHMWLTERVKAEAVELVSALRCNPSHSPPADPDGLPHPLRALYLHSSVTNRTGISKFAL